MQDLVTTPIMEWDARPPGPWKLADLPAEVLRNIVKHVSENRFSQNPFFPILSHPTGPAKDNLSATEGIETILLLGHS